MSASLMLRDGASRAQSREARKLLDNFGSLSYEKARAALEAVSMDREMYRYLFAKYISDFTKLHDSCSICAAKPDNKDKNADYVKENGCWTLQPMCSQCRKNHLRKHGYQC